MLSNDLQNTINKLETAFGNLWFWTSDAFRLNFIIDELTELNKMGIIEKRIDRFIGIEWRLNPVVGCEAQLSFQKGQLVKAPISFSELPSLRGQLNYGVLIVVDDQKQRAVLNVLASDNPIVTDLLRINGKYTCIVDYARIIDIEGNEWARCGHCQKPLPLDQLSDTVVSLCESCADSEDYDLIWEMIDLQEDGQSIEHFKTINSGRAYEKYMLDMEFWQNKVAKVERAKALAYKQRVAHEDCLDAAKERRDVK